MGRNNDIMGTRTLDKTDYNYNNEVKRISVTHYIEKDGKNENWSNRSI